MAGESGGWIVKAMYASLAVALVGGVLTLKDAVSPGSAGDNMRYFKSTKTGEVQKYTIEEWTKKLKELNSNYIDTYIEPKSPQIAQKMRDAMNGTGDAMMEMLPPLPSWGTPQFPLEDSNGEKTMLAAKKCPKCGEIFVTYTKDGKWTDKCPKCGYSQREEKKKALAKKKSRKSKSKRR